MGAAELDLATLRCEADGRVLTVRVEAPPFNYMTAEMQEDFVQLVAAVEDDPGVGAVVVTGGVPGRYITHFDIADLLGSARTLPASVPRPAASLVVRSLAAITRIGGEPLCRLLAYTPAASLVLLSRFQAACRAVLFSPAVWIAAIDGPCGGGGLEVSTFFDVRLASSRARFELPELSIGLTTTFGGRRLAALVGPARALELMLEAGAITADEAQAAGLVNHVVAGDVVEHARALAARYARRPRAVVAAQKALLHADVGLRESLLREAVAQVVGLSSPVTRAALAHWLERQEPAGDSTFLTDPEPWSDGTALDLNPPPPHRGRSAG